MKPEMSRRKKGVAVGSQLHGSTLRESKIKLNFKQRMDISASIEEKKKMKEETLVFLLGSSAS